MIEFAYSTKCLSLFMPTFMSVTELQVLMFCNSVTKCYGVTVFKMSIILIPCKMLHFNLKYYC